jgi:antitoxin component YwqK of YwqJK toxin-antitoxin module
LTLTLHLNSVQSQPDTIFNQTDAGHLKQGWWKKNYPNGKPMYKGFFKDDKPVGTLYRYFESGSLKAILQYDEKSEYAHARLYYEDGQLAAEGVFYNAVKDSTWSYYSYYSRTLTAKESYNKGLRHGMMVNYYGNGAISEVVEWKNDRKEGVWEQYFEQGGLKMKGYYMDNKLEGDFIVHYENGNPYLRGFYVNDRRQGRWTFYKEDGTLEVELDYLNGKALNEDQLTEKQQELFRTIDASEGKFEEPDESDFIIPNNR